MNIPEAKNESLPLLEVIEALGETEWRKGSSSEYVAREHGLWVLKKQPHTVPTVSFRFKLEDPQVIKVLSLAIACYCGEISWVLTEHQRATLPGTNWTIEPFRVGEILEAAKAEGVTVGEYLFKYECNFASIAFEDLNGLTAHIKKILGLNYSK